MIKAILVDAGGVLYLRSGDAGYVNLPLVEFIRENRGKYLFGVISTTQYDLALKYTIHDFERHVGPGFS